MDFSLLKTEMYTYEREKENIPCNCSISKNSEIMVTDILYFVYMCIIYVSVFIF